MNRQTWIAVGVVAFVAVVAGFIVKRKSDQASSDATQQSQLPAQEEQANYNVPPDIGASVNAGGGITLPSGDNVTYTPSQANALPIVTPYAGQ